MKESFMNQEEINLKLKQLRSELLNIILDETKEESDNKLESFEAKKNKIEQQFEAAYSEYLEHLKNGYEVIINEIATQLKK
jgi:hypothetical protein